MLLKQFFLSMEPPTVTAQERKVSVIGGKPHHYKPEEVKRAECIFRESLYPFRPEEPYAGAIRMMVKWCFTPTGKHQSGEWRTTRPDTDNLQKMFKDIMQKLGFFYDDAQVCSEIIEKCWWEVPGIFVRLESL